MKKFLEVLLIKNNRHSSRSMSIAIVSSLIHPKNTGVLSHKGEVP